MNIWLFSYMIFCLFYSILIYPLIGLDIIVALFIHHISLTIYIQLPNLLTTIHVLFKRMTCREE